MNQQEARAADAARNAAFYGGRLAEAQQNAVDALAALKLAGDAYNTSNITAQGYMGYAYESHKETVDAYIDALRDYSRAEVAVSAAVIEARP